MRIDHEGLHQQWRANSGQSQLIEILRRFANSSSGMAKKNTRSGE